MSERDYDACASVYDTWTADLNASLAHYVSLAKETEGPIVELGVGTGRIAIPIARETGKRVIGIDRSPAMLAVGRERAGALEIDFRAGDFRDFAIEEPVDLVICPFRALLHAPTWADKRRVFESVAAALRPGGRFVWNSFVFSPFVAARNHGTKQTRGSDLWELVRQVPADNRIDLTRGRSEREDGMVKLWWVTKSEWEGLLDVSGFETEALYGWFDRRPFDEDSLEFVWVARKRA